MCVCISLSIYSLIDTSSCFHVLNILYNAAYRYTYLFKLMFSFSLGNYPLVVLGFLFNVTKIKVIINFSTCGSFILILKDTQETE